MEVTGLVAGAAAGLPRGEEQGMMPQRASPEAPGGTPLDAAAVRRGPAAEPAGLVPEGYVAAARSGAEARPPEERGGAAEAVAGAGGLRGALDVLRGREPAGGILDRVR